MDNQTTWSVYVHIVPKEVSGNKNDKYYIGITSRNVKERWRNGKAYKRNRAFYPAIQKYGWNNIKHIVLMEGLSEGMAKESERFLIAKYQTRKRNKGYNITIGGDGNKGCRTTKGIKYNEAQREQCRLARLGKTMSEDAKKKIAESSRKRWTEGGDFYEMYKKKGIMPFKNKPMPKYGFDNKTSKKVLCKETKEIFGSACEASRLGYGCFSTICAVCRGDRKSLYKRHFAYVDDYLKDHQITYEELLQTYHERRGNDKNRILGADCKIS